MFFSSQHQCVYFAQFWLFEEKSHHQNRNIFNNMKSHKIEILYSFWSTVNGEYSIRHSPFTHILYLLYTQTHWLLPYQCTLLTWFYSISREIYIYIMCYQWMVKDESSKYYAKSRCLISIWFLFSYFVLFVSI